MIKVLISIIFFIFYLLSFYGLVNSMVLVYFSDVDWVFKGTLLASLIYTCFGIYNWSVKTISDLLKPKNKGKI